MKPGTPALERTQSAHRLGARRGVAAGLVLALAISVPAAFLAASASGEESTMVPKSFEQMFELSRAEKKGLTLSVQGQTLTGAVTAISDDLVELRSQQYDRIVVRIDRIDAVAHQ